MSNATLLVPIEAEALAVNSSVSKLPFYRWQMNYQQLEQFLSPDPLPFQGQSETNFNTDKNKGVYLHWQLPEAFRDGQKNRTTGEIEFPLVPNRWLVVRFYDDLTARKARAWVIESDCPTEDADEGSEYLVDQGILKAWSKSSDPNRNTVNGKPRPVPDSPEPTMQLLGKSFPVEQWSEKGIKEMFLTSVAPGNPFFTAYQPHGNNIFSFHDKLLPDTITKDTLSYQIVGWFSNPDQDPMAKWQNSTDTDPYEQALKDLGWSVKNNSEKKATRSLYHGFIHGIDWDLNGDKPTSAVKDVTNLHVAIGNNAIDAFTAMISAQIRDKAKNADTAAAALLDTNPQLGEFIEALLHDSLEVLEEKNGESVLDLKIRESWFESKHGGLHWEIVDREASVTEGKNADTKKI